MRTKFVFTGRYFSGAQIFTAEELAYQLATGKARVLMEPVPLWDRAVSSALDTLAARSPPPATPSSRLQSGVVILRAGEPFGAEVLAMSPAPVPG